MSFVASPTVTEWVVTSSRTLCGEGMAQPVGLQRVETSEFCRDAEALWVLRGVRSNERYTERTEKERLVALQEGLGRPSSKAAALLPIRKSEAWWNLAQDERRVVFEARSRHIELGSKFLPAIARRLYHGRELGEPFDFLTWFEFDPREASAFDELVGRLRETEEWTYVERELEIRLLAT